MTAAKAYLKAKQILKDTQFVINDAQLFITASSLAYTTILSLIPVLALSFVIFRAFGGLEKLYETLEPFILSNLSEGTSEDVMQKLRGLINNVSVGTIGAGGFLGLVFTSMSLMLSIENTFNRIWKVENTRSLFHRIASYWLFITLGPLALSVGLGIATSEKLPLTRLLPTWSGAFALAACLLTLVYKFVPNTMVRWKFALISGFWSAVIWSLTRLGFNLYVDRYASYNKIYGSLAAVPILLFWIYLIWLMILAGAALSATLQKRLDPGPNEKQISPPISTD
ncbi:MAG: YhjD/YihY/BrkB family envelope integrity protein [Bdellovibrionia bacterium]